MYIKSHGKRKKEKRRKKLAAPTPGRRRRDAGGRRAPLRRPLPVAPAGGARWIRRRESAAAFVLPRWRTSSPSAAAPPRASERRSPDPVEASPTSWCLAGEERASSLLPHAAPAEDLHRWSGLGASETENEKGGERESREVTENSSVGTAGPTMCCAANVAREWKGGGINRACSSHGRLESHHRGKFRGYLVLLHVN